MLSFKKKLPINELQVGMISANDITIQGNILLGSGIAITESILINLKKNYLIDELEVYLEDNSSKSLKLKTVKELESTFNEFSSNLENIFDNISTLDVPQMNELRTFSQNIQQEFTATGIVIRNIIFYGSGNDSIYRHSVNVAAISFILGKWLGLDEKELGLLTYSAILHDFGKLEISKDILNKKENLTSDESDTLKTHPVVGYHFVKQIPYLDPSVGLTVLMHHERMDGSGYPLHVSNDKIPKFAKIIAIADVFDELNSNRYAKKIKGPLEALKVIQDESITELDPIYCNMFLNQIITYYMGENVLLSDKRSCKIIQIQINDLTNPIMLDDNGFIDLKKEKDLYVEKLLI
ncbi:HD-GYP domain-containing protein [Clostridium tagluense]|uniref:HD-GYP domain-containing protein n=1 Tax=Clostridium tagluense TaxID=360422 RepID=UPI001C0D8E4A|nr:HD-GYP domain-containing protein [Clostridium tagluense]MBU3128359.1 HD-GYP domain-containing protein [Clostridium tagluense]MCB2313822.1 HD-GYP domain-containing protein [Clostridium tagluense]MCB2318628.1 HD-GYP domain-containing protein [Clostridium tagluense]MCB2323503.1 HD-GYP domain-containing protein [Clostridium tagluense]MCB2328372.1 HD-GYP domain-containing protein [Clostridium tagluense]